MTKLRNPTLQPSISTQRHGDNTFSLDRDRDQVSTHCCHLHKYLVLSFFWNIYHQSMLSIDQFNLQKTNRLSLFIFCTVDGGLRFKYQGVFWTKFCWRRQPDQSGVGSLGDSKQIPKTRVKHTWALDIQLRYLNIWHIVWQLSAPSSRHNMSNDTWPASALAW